ncbi:MAG TPA: helix-turn-helix domain-containing protein, partial [Candidatus Angelobacter sp.]|nr:helix-turn-helix domain-containing protein [Candidatus Angelobacter sp.]
PQNRHYADHLSVSLSLTDAVFSLNSPLEGLTEKQKTVIIDAFKNGNYDFPRKIGSEAPAKKLDIREPTQVIHRGKQNGSCLRTCSEYRDTNGPGNPRYTF